MASSLESLEAKLKNLPNSHGVYIFKNVKGEIIYIGKANSLRNRVRSYFRPADKLDVKTQRLAFHITDLDMMATDNEIESLILEANLVRQHKPRYNVRLKDDKHFPYIKITTNEPFPRILVVRRLLKDGATYFGPYTNSQGMWRTVRALSRLFTIRTCNLTIPHPTAKQYKVCLDYHIKRCGGPCENFQSKAEYDKLVQSVIMALSGRSRELMNELTERMRSASENLRFEEARILRDQIDALESITDRQQRADAGEVVDRDIISIARESSDAVAVVMQIRQGVLLGRQDFQLSAEPDETDEAMLETFITQYYNNQPNLPEEIYFPLELQTVRIIASWLKKVKGKPVRIYTPKIGVKLKMVDLAAINARMLLDELLIHKRIQSERTSKMVTDLKDALRLPISPRTIACFDISNTGETDIVGSCAYFDNGRQKKTEYRHFKIKGVSGQDDFSMMREIVGRYFHRLKEEEKQPPDLVVVDGGKGQLSAAKAELESLGFPDQLIISLAKRLEEIFLPGNSDSITIPRSSPALMLLKRVRDEAHRFAITYNRKVRGKRTIKSALDDINGVGPAKARALLRHFGSVERIKSATRDELTSIKGINPSMADKILSSLQTQ